MQKGTIIIISLATAILASAGMLLFFGVPALVELITEFDQFNYI